MLAYKNRFHGYNTLRFVYKNGDARRSQRITLKYTSNPRRSTPRGAVVVSKKVYKRAVGRNKIRRRLYEILRCQLPKLKDDMDIILIVSSAEILTMDFKELEIEVFGLFESADIYK